MRFAQTLKFMSFNIRFDGRSRGHDLRVANLGCIDMPKGIDWGNPLQQVFGKISLSVQRDAPAEPPKSIWGETPWVERQEKVADTVLFYDPDVVGFQEVLVNQMKDLTKLLGDDLYDHVGVGRDDGKEAGEYVPIFYKREKLELVDLEHIWLSNTPSIPGSIGWDAGQTRMATIASFRYKDGSVDGPGHSADLMVLNTHLDDRGVKSREQSARLILRHVTERLSASNASPAVILLGDFNSEESEGAYQSITQPDQESFGFHFQDTRYKVNVNSSRTSSWYGYNYTYTGFYEHDTPTRIDYVFVGNNRDVDYAPRTIDVLRHGVLGNRFDDGVFISDHRPVFAELSL